MKLIKTLNILARTTGFKLVTLGLEMGGIGYPDDIVLYHFVILQKFKGIIDIFLMSFIGSILFLISKKFIYRLKFR